MKTITKSVSTLLATLAFSFLAGCATQGDHKVTTSGGGDTLFAAPVVRVDRLITKSALAEGTVYDLDLVQIAWVEPSGKPVTFFDKDLKREVNAVTRFHREQWTSTTGEKVLLSFVGGTVPAITNGIFAKEIARIAACKAGAVCDSTVVLNEITTLATGGVGVGGSGGSAAALSQSGAQSTTDVGVNTGGSLTKPR